MDSSVRRRNSQVQNNFRLERSAVGRLNLREDAYGSDTIQPRATARTSAADLGSAPDAVNSARERLGDTNGTAVSGGHRGGTATRRRIRRTGIAARRTAAPQPQAE